jgi:hypothetical protein
MTISVSMDGPPRAKGKRARKTRAFRAQRKALELQGNQPSGAK